MFDESCERTVSMAKVGVLWAVSSHAFNPLISHPRDPKTFINSKDFIDVYMSLLMSMSKHSGSTRTTSWSKGFGRRGVTSLRLTSLSPKTFHRICSFPKGSHGFLNRRPQYSTLIEISIFNIFSLKLNFPKCYPGIEMGLIPQSPADLLRDFQLQT